MQDKALDLGFTPSPLMRKTYGHFVQEKFLRAGHNTSKANVVAVTPAPTGRPTGAEAASQGEQHSK